MRCSLAFSPPQGFGSLIVDNNYPSELSLHKDMLSVNIRHRQSMDQLHLPTQIGQRFSASLIS